MGGSIIVGMKGSDAASAANRLGLDYRAEAARMGVPPVGITDVHTHINGVRAAEIYGSVCDLFGIRRTYSQTQLVQAEGVRSVLGDRIRFIALPDFMSEDKAHAFREGYLESISVFHDRFGARMVKFWAAPRFRDYAEELGKDDVVAMDSPWRIRAAELAQSLGMMFMVHIGDPDTWFKAKYADSSMYGTKVDQYVPFERMLDRFNSPWIAAHMGGWPEDLSFLSGLLGRHDNLYMDTSATKWMVRELSKHEPSAFGEFLERWRGRIMFGSDIVTHDDHLGAADDGHPMSALAGDEASAFDLYASRYWALRTLFESDYEGESPIADPDLAMCEPARYDEMAAPMLRGMGFSDDLLRVLYHDAAADLLEPFYGS